MYFTLHTPGLFARGGGGVAWHGELARRAQKHGNRDTNGRNNTTDGLVLAWGRTELT
jgi:hypothetical protein